MEWTEIGGMVAIISGAIGGLFTGIRALRSDKFKQKQEAGQNLLGVYEKLVHELRAEVARVRKDCHEEIVALKTEHNSDKLEWEHEKQVLRTEIDTLRSRLSKLEKTPPQGIPIIKSQTDDM